MCILTGTYLVGSCTVSTILGTVKWFNEKKGFGFISEEVGRDIFVHHSAIAGEGFHTLKEGETVEYEVEGGQKGLKATNVRRLGGEVRDGSVVEPRHLQFSKAAE